MRKLVLCAALLMQDCAVFESRELFVACRAADTYTTIKVVQAGGMETNPLLKNIVMGHHWLAFVAIEAGISWWVWHNWKNVPTELKPAVNVISCAPVPGNIKVLKEQQDINSRAFHPNSGGYVVGER